jgi:hypothetical protein
MYRVRTRCAETSLSRFLDRLVVVRQAVVRFVFVEISERRELVERAAHRLSRTVNVVDEIADRGRLPAILLGCFRNTPAVLCERRDDLALRDDRQALGQHARMREHHCALFITPEPQDRLERLILAHVAEERAAELLFVDALE